MSDAYEADMIATALSIGDLDEHLESILAAAKFRKSEKEEDANASKFNELTPGTKVMFNYRTTP